ncbi:sodium channel protein Nach [Diorhabda sublineata]|uniref:sodium channel protein Nach n=1 Tax=Diorhabda sublineata TaxID=1163346 RepID=UPI0024E0E594|nr:sodium channel protein Nach [Diorhabda sublineata]
MERDRFNWNTSFPPATLCTEKKYDLEKLEEYVEKNNSIKDKELFKKFVKSLLEATYLNLDSIVEYEGISGDNFVDLIYKFRFPFKPTITSSAGMEKLEVDPTFTEMGLCYSFNSQIAVYSSPEIWYNNSWELLPEKNTLSVNPLDGEVFINVINVTSGYQVYFHSSFETVDIASKNIRTSDNNFLQLHITGLAIIAADGIKSLTPKQRKCRFYYESNLPHFAVYSYILCRMECRASLAKRLCGCLPHFYRKLAGEKVCDVKGLHCLAKYTERLIFLKRECSCVANCEETVYIVDFTDEREWFLGSNLQWGMIEYPKMRLRRDVIFGFTDLLVYIGGMAGLFLGCSFLSFMEIVYFFTLRLFWFVVRYGDETNQKKNVNPISYNRKYIIHKWHRK